MLGSGLGQAAFFGRQQEQPQVIEVKMHAAMLLRHPHAFCFSEGLL
jgi:hypothetical protein